ncbi:RB1-inducible coiled-coil protein 1-like [Corticium candelabrum]|uniref:RB1-inducible coiled-coil protein 1-like n=1 Tax=Corticium candelabrum TaxID=121492 RepID=UPI002E257C59|nr:RB1-inducible coiled-coil protein 1-like [Corticium candelabrum]
MLVVFMGDVGRTATFDMQLAMGSVSQLQDTIANRLHIPVEKQVLLSCSGETLQPSCRVANFSTGTETSPIFLFDKSNIESLTPPAATVHSTNDGKLLSQVQMALQMRPSQETVVRRAQLATEFHHHAVELHQSCAQLVNEQGMQQRAWKAVIANLERIGRAFSDRLETLKELYNEILLSKVNFIEHLQTFDVSISELRKIILPQCLLRSPEFTGLLSPSTKESFELVPSNTDTTKDDEVSLLDWISAHDQKCLLEELGANCHKSLDQLSSKHLEDIMSKMSSVQAFFANHEMKEVSGLDDRIHMLKQQLNDAASLEKEVLEISQGFQQNKMRAQSLRDASVLPDLCAGHERQLKMLVQNHTQLKEVRCRFTNAKHELCANLHTRLRWVVFVQKQVADCDSSIILRCESLKKLKKKLEIVEQVNSAPRLFITAAAEVVRRRKYNTQFVTWCEDVTTWSHDVLSEETAMRGKFNKAMGTHFLQCFFPGLAEKPPSFLMRKPLMFNESLPEMTETDLEMFKIALPSLAEYAVVSEPFQLCHPTLPTKVANSYDDDTNLRKDIVAPHSDEITLLKEELRTLQKSYEEERRLADTEKQQIRQEIEMSFKEQIERLETEKHCLVNTEREWQEKSCTTLMELEKSNKHLTELRSHISELELQLTISQEQTASENSVEKDKCERLEQERKTVEDEMKRMKKEMEEGLRNRTEWKEKMQNERQELIQTMNKQHQEQVEALMAQHKIEMSTKLDQVTQEWEVKCTELENDLKELESSKSVLITQQSESEKQLTFKLKSDYEARIATLQTEKLQELEVVKQKNDSLLKTSIAKAIESGKEEARQLFDLEIEEMKRGMEEMRDEIGDERREKEEKEKELKLMKKMVDNIRRELEEEKHKMSLLESQLAEPSSSSATDNKQSKQLQSPHPPASHEPIVSAPTTNISERGNEMASEEGAVTHKLMEKERDLREAKREAEAERMKAKKLQEDKEEFEKKLIRKGLEMESKYQELDLTVADMTRMLAERGVTYDATRLSKSYQPKVSLQDFKVGDLALFCFCQDTGSYRAYSISSTRYYLHPDSVEALGLQGEER